MAKLIPWEGFWWKIKKFPFLSTKGVAECPWKTSLFSAPFKGERKKAGKRKKSAILLILRIL